MRSDTVCCGMWMICILCYKNNTSFNAKQKRAHEHGVPLPYCGTVLRRYRTRYQYAYSVCLGRICRVSSTPHTEHSSHTVLVGTFVLLSESRAVKLPQCLHRRIAHTSIGVLELRRHSWRVLSESRAVKLPQRLHRRTAHTFIGVLELPYCPHRHLIECSRGEPKHRNMIGKYFSKLIPSADPVHAETPVRVEKLL